MKTPINKYSNKNIMNTKQISSWLCMLVLCFGFGSCKKYLDQVPDDRITIEEVFQKKSSF